MSTYVVDASVAAKWFTEEEHAERALAVLRDNERLHAPDFFLLEMDNIVCKWLRRGVITVTVGEDIRRELETQSIEYHASGPLRDRAFDIANRTGRALYDCLYVSLAVALGGQMVTADRRLYEALADGPFARYLLWVEEAGVA